MDIPTIRPAALQPGDTIGIVAPAGPVENRDALAGGIAALRAMGFRVRYDERIFESRRYLAGTDASRAEELMRYFESPEIQGVVSLRGGYGCSRLIPLLDKKRLRRQCKVFMGFSDMTTLHLFFGRRFGWVTLHGPMATSQSLADMTPDRGEHLRRLWTDPGYLPEFSFPEMQAWHHGTAEGGLTGGCLSIIVASLGTPYEIQTEGKILFLEDHGEEPYRLDRMITQLHLAGKLDGVAGLLLGTFGGCAPEKGDYTAADTLRELFENMNVPIMSNFPAGHGADNWPFPLGLPVRLDADNNHIQFLKPFASVRP